MELSTVIEPGATVMVPINEILTWESCDGAGPHRHTEDCVDHGNCWNEGVESIGRTAWDTVLERKRNDSHYEDVVESLKTRGFVRPLTGQANSFERKFGDGHHRLAAAIELGMSHVPIRFDFSINISNDSGSWYEGAPIPDVTEDY